MIPTTCILYWVHSVPTGYHHVNRNYNSQRITEKYNTDKKHSVDYQSIGCDGDIMTDVGIGRQERSLEYFRPFLDRIPLSWEKMVRNSLLQVLRLPDRGEERDKSASGFLLSRGKHVLFFKKLFYTQTTYHSSTYFLWTIPTNMFWLWAAIAAIGGLPTSMSWTTTSIGRPSSRAQAQRTTNLISNQMVADGSAYYGDSSFVVKEFSQYNELEEIVQLASQPIPERPDGIVCVVKYSSTMREDCRATEADYERLARANPATIFLRCMQEYDNADLLLGQVNIQNWPTFDVFYGGNRVARVEGNSLSELEEVLGMYQLQNSNLDLFSEEATQKRKLSWGETVDMTATPKTTNRFVPGYDWNQKGGFFDEQGAQAGQDFEDAFGNWVPNIDDDEDDPK